MYTADIMQTQAAEQQSRERETIMFCNTCPYLLAYLSRLKEKLPSTLALGT